MKVTVVGAGSVGRSIARELVSAGRDVVIIDREPGAMKVASVPEADWILGDACDMPTLVRADVANADVVVAATGDDVGMSLRAKVRISPPRAQPVTDPVPAAVAYLLRCQDATGSFDPRRGLNGSGTSSRTMRSLIVRISSGPATRISALVRSSGMIL